ncbi:MAG: AbrB/MazE/SpoVT family DNA-binding domain-containing protein [Chromatiaceae bacterium]|nr:AbrB/MazE/SpoVT family DNA-binding domain-containing protein [Chromatiaceae bacterium]
MSTVRLSSKGQIVIPKPIRDRRRWREGQILEVIETEQGLVLQEGKRFPESRLEDLAGCLKYDGKAKTLEEMEAAIAKGAREKAGNDRR